MFSLISSQKFIIPLTILTNIAIQLIFSPLCIFHESHLFIFVFTFLTIAIYLITIFVNIVQIDYLHY